MPVHNPSLRLLADRTASLLLGLSTVLDQLALLKGEPTTRRAWGSRHLYIPDWMPVFINAGRAFVTTGAVTIFWILSAWPSGPLAITWTVIAVVVLALQADEIYARAVSYTLGTGVAALCAAIMLLAGLPNVETFAGFSLMLGLYLVPVGALMAQPWNTMMFAPMVGNFVPLLAPANQQTYDTVQFYNSAFAVVTGCTIAALSFRLIPSLSIAQTTRRLLALTLRDLRRLATGARRSSRDWQGRMYSRLAALPNEAEPLQRGQLMAALSVGTEIIYLRRVAAQAALSLRLDSALAEFARGDSLAAIAGLAELDNRLASLPASQAAFSVYMRARGRILSICDALAQHSAYFNVGEFV